MSKKIHSQSHCTVFEHCSEYSKIFVLLVLLEEYKKFMKYNVSPVAFRGKNMSFITEKALFH